MSGSGLGSGREGEGEDGGETAVERMRRRGGVDSDLDRNTRARDGAGSAEDWGAFNSMKKPALVSIQSSSSSLSSVEGSSGAWGRRERPSAPVCFSHWGQTTFYPVRTL